VVGRESGHVRLTLTERSVGETLKRVLMRASRPVVIVHTDEWGGYNGLPGMGRTRPRVCHADRELARDDETMSARSTSRRWRVCGLG
jgi:transposase